MSSSNPKLNIVSASVRTKNFTNVTLIEATKQNSKGKGKAIPIQASIGPETSR
jgi:hypothetical protein